MDAPRLILALGALAALISLALLTWIAVRVEQVHRRPPPLPPPASPPEPCRRLHVADLPAEWSQLRGQRRVGFMAEDDAPFPPRR